MLIKKIKGKYYLCRKSSGNLKTNQKYKIWFWVRYKYGKANIGYISLGRGISVPKELVGKRIKFKVICEKIGRPTARVNKDRLKTLHKKGISQRQIAKKLKVSVATINRLLKKV